ncbi:TonB-dependent receptor [Bacteroidia bacterium]|nr:TonB-dependent receptor [Bacteroidia bacterium]
MRMTWKISVVILCCIGWKTALSQTQDTTLQRRLEGTVVSGQRDAPVRIDATNTKILPTISANIEDLIKTLPGVHSNTELSSQYSVRGGNYDENLIYVNDIEIFRPFLIRSGEQEGLSFINPDLVSSLKFSAGGFEAKYGDKMSSVLDIRYKHPTKFGASATLDLLGASASVEAISPDKKLSLLFSVRQKSNQYLMSSMQVKGDYKSSFTDIQTLIAYTIDNRWSVDFLGNYAINKYQLAPTSRYTKFGTLGNPINLYIHYEGAEVDNYNTKFAASSVSFRPSSKQQHKLTLSVFQSVESETYDILGAYWLSQTDNEMGKDPFGNPVELMGVGSFIDHARNVLDAIVYNVNYQTQIETDRCYWILGMKYQHEDIVDGIDEWKLVDSVGYNSPNAQDLPGEHNTPSVPVLQNTYRSNNHVISDRFMTFAQNTITINARLRTILGARMVYWDYNNEWLCSPRASLIYTPQQRLSLRFATGLYYQPPFYRELRNLQGQLNPHIKAQRSIHFVGALDYFMTLWNRPFKVVTEVYYKDLSNLIPYEIDNVRIRYAATNNAKGYATGLDVRMNGEFVKGVESWFGFSWMQTQESINGMAYVPRPTDQRLNFNLFFQDYLTSNENIRAHINMIFGTGVPNGTTLAFERPELYANRLRLPAYRRVDIGFSYQPPFVKKYKAWISLEVFNVFDINNTISYMWVTDVYGAQYAVANYLTPRLFNLKLSAEL